MAVHPNSLANLIPPQPGEARNPAGRPSAGATLREQVNALAQSGLTEKELRKIARDQSLPWTRRAAANRILRTLEAPDLADFAGLLRGENSLEDLRAMGVNTEAVKRFKQRTRKQMSGHGEEAEVEEVIDREIELYDRSGEDFDRVTNHTDGHPTQNIKADIDTKFRNLADGEAEADSILASLREKLG
jgi:hypothetical protein